MKFYDTGMTPEEAAEFPNSFVLISTPMKMDDAMLNYMAVLSHPGAKGNGVVDVEALVPKHWTQKRWFVTECAIPQKAGLMQPYNRIAICEWLNSPQTTSEPIYVNDIALHGTFLVLPWDEAAHYFHCHICAQNAMHWIMERQDQWHEKANSRGVQEAKTALN